MDTIEFIDSMSQKRQKAIKFYDSIIKDIESKTNAVIVSMVRDKSFSDDEKTIALKALKSFERTITQSVEYTKDLLKNDFSQSIHSIVDFENSNTNSQRDLDDITDISKRLNNNLTYYNQFYHNSSIATTISETCAQVVSEHKDLFKDSSDLFYDGMNHVLDSAFNCQMDKTEIENNPNITSINRYPIFDKEGNMLLQGEYYQTLNNSNAKKVEPDTM